jgi:ATP-dependent Clp protease ATP-binding subunit ClpA
MNLEKLTQKSIECLGKARQKAIDNSNSSIEPIHFLYSLLSDREGLAVEIFRKMGADISALTESAESAAAALPRACGESALP